MEKKLILDEILDFNKEFVENKEYENYKASKLPEKGSNCFMYGYKINRTFT